MLHAGPEPAEYRHLYASGIVDSPHTVVPAKFDPARCIVPRTVFAGNSSKSRAWAELRKW
jgi:hypothetical protein